MRDVLFGRAWTDAYEAFSLCRRKQMHFNPALPTMNL